MSFSFSPPSSGSSRDVYQAIFDKFGHQVDYSSSSPDEFTKQAQDFFEQFMKWAVTGSIIDGVVLMIAIIAVVYAIIKCLKKAGTVIPAYGHIPTAEEHHKAYKSSLLTPEVEIAIPPPDSQGEFATMEGFISYINKEKLIRFTPEQLEEISNNYSTKLGSGGFGMVYKGELPNGEQVAVKVLSLSMETEEQFKAEVSTVGRTYHTNVVRLFGFCFHHDKRALVYEYVENESLDKLLFGSQNRETKVDKLHKIAIGTAKGIAYLHEGCQPRIIHYDIKPENILLDKNLEPKVADFGLAKLCSRESNNLVWTEFKGTIGYAPPEMWKPSPMMTDKCDVYSFGILLFEIVGRRRHFDYDYGESPQLFPKWARDMFENNELEVMLSLYEGKDREKAKRMLMVALRCVQDLPEHRPLMSNVVRMLEGDTQISPSPFPFQKSCNPNLTSNGSNEDSGTSGSRQADSSVQSGSKLKGAIY